MCINIKIVRHLEKYPINRYNHKHNLNVINTKHCTVYVMSALSNIWLAAVLGCKNVDLSVLSHFYNTLSVLFYYFFFKSPIVIYLSSENIKNLSNKILPVILY